MISDQETEAETETDIERILRTLSIWEKIYLGWGGLNELMDN